MCIKSVRGALQIETSTTLKSHEKVEFMSLIRRVTLRSVIENFIGSFFLDGWDFNFIEEYMEFQDILEDVTAKSAVMPRSLALPLLLWPFRRQRLKLENIILNRLEDTLPNIHKKQLGFWLAELHDFDLDEISQFIIGLLFAGMFTFVCFTCLNYVILKIID